VIDVVLDTNTLASGAVATGGTIGTLFDAWFLDRFYGVILSDHILNELARTLRKRYFNDRLSQDDLTMFQERVRATARVVTVTPPIPTVLTSQADNVVLATVQTAGVPYIVSGDREMQQLGQFQEIAILSPRAFLARLSHEAGWPRDPT